MEEIYRGLGYGGAQPPEDIKALTDKMIAEIAEICRPSFGYIVSEGLQVDRLGIVVDGVDFRTGKIIAGYLDNAEAIAFFVATAGREFDTWLHEPAIADDIWNMFLADTIGSEIAEATARAAGAEVEKLAAAKECTASNPYSPGYCGWGVREQRKLFSFFPTEPCGITLTESSLMTPVKSVSGFIALGRELEKMPYGCEICSLKDCYKKRTATT